MRRCDKRHSDGFTLIELLVVITIVGVLSAVVVFSVSGLDESSAEATCSVDAATLTDAEDTAMATGGAYLTEAELIAQKYLKGEVGGYDVVVTGGGSGYSLTPVRC